MSRKLEQGSLTLLVFYDVYSAGMWPAPIIVMMLEPGKKKTFVTKFYGFGFSGANKSNHYRHVLV